VSDPISSRPMIRNVDAQPLLRIDMDAPTDFGMDAVIDFDMGNDFLLDDGPGRATSETSLVAGSTRKRGKSNKPVRLITSFDFPF